jgi:hypothetical protein
MMKIHTTQNLSLMEGTQPATTPIISGNVQYNSLSKMRKQNLADGIDTYEKSVAFKGAKKLIENGIKKGSKAVNKETWGDKVLNSRFFKAFLDIMDHEVFVQSAISAIVCMCLRPLAILALPSKKDKQDNIYASAHSISSGQVGLASSLLLTVPFSKGIKYTQKHALVNVKEDILKRMYPQLDSNSIWKDPATKAERAAMGEWKDVFGNVFSTDFKKVITVAKPKHVSEISADTLKSIGFDINEETMSKPLKEWRDKNGNDLVSKLDLKDIFVAIKEDGMSVSKKTKESAPNFFSLQHVDKDFLKEAMPNLDVSTIEKEGKRLPLKEWKNLDGSKFELNPESIHISSYRETADSIPLITGATRVETKTGEVKYVSYQTNNLTKEELDELQKLENEGKLDEKAAKMAELALRVPSKLGSPINQKMMDAESSNNIKFKLLSWMPDIITRPFVAAGTIALIPLILKGVFHIEKAKKPETTPVDNNQTVVTGDDFQKNAEIERKEVA